VHNIRRDIENTILPLLPMHVASMLRSIPAELLTKVTEIRLRCNQPLAIVLDNGDIMLDRHGVPVTDIGLAYHCCHEDVQKTLQCISKNSLYAYEQDICQGFITIAGGHRVGIAGQAVMAGPKIATQKNVSSLNIRLAREVLNCATAVLPYILANNRVQSSLLIGPPRCGKTTLLRDMIRQISTGLPNLGFAGVNVGLVDERSEIAACQNGVATVNLGPRVDILDACPKAQGLLMLIRSLAPAVVATDELGREEDCNAVQEALHAGVSVLATVHAKTVTEALSRPYIGDLIRSRYFERYVILGSTPHIGAVKQIIAAATGDVLFPTSTVAEQN
jgi:stage III sporulation protein AA